MIDWGIDVSQVIFLKVEQIQTFPGPETSVLSTVLSAAHQTPTLYEILQLTEQLALRKPDKLGDGGACL